jgi:hypothetical protein
MKMAHRYINNMTEPMTLEYSNIGMRIQGYKKGGSIRLFCLKTVEFLSKISEDAPLNRQA